MNPPSKNISSSTAVPDRYCKEWPRPDNQTWCTRFEKLMESLKSGGTVALIGNRGTGKTRLASEAMRDGARNTGYYSTAMGIFLEIRDSYRSKGPSELEIVKRLTEASLLIIDEIQERGNTEWEDRILTHIIDLRYGAMRPTILIGNLTVTGLNETLGTSIMSRLTENGAIMTITGPSHRNTGGAL